MKCSKAFTLLELMLVVCLCSFLAGLTCMQLSFLDNAMVKQEISKLVAVCTYVRQLALATNKEKVVIFDRQKNEYSFEGFHEKLSASMSFGCQPGIKGPPSTQITVVEKPITFMNEKIIFYPTGTMSAGTVYIVDKKNALQYALSNAISCAHYVHTYRYSDGWKLY